MFDDLKLVNSASSAAATTATVAVGGRLVATDGRGGEGDAAEDGPAPIRGGLGGGGGEEGEAVKKATTSPV